MHVKAEIKHANVKAKVKGKVDAKVKAKVYTAWGKSKCMVKD